VEGAGYMGEVGYKPLIEVDEANEGLDFCHIFQSQPFFDSSNFDWVHPNMALRQDKTKIFDCEAFERALLSL